MYKKTLLSLAVASSLGLTGCLEGADSGAANANPEYRINNPEIDGKTWPLFNAVTGELPVPSDLNFASSDNPNTAENEADGTYNVPNTRPPVTSGINALDGNSLTAQFDIKISGSLLESQELDARSFIPSSEINPALSAVVPYIPNPNQNVFLLPLTYPGGDPVLSASLDTDGDGDTESVEIPTFPQAISFQRANAALADEDAGNDLAALSTLQELATPIARAEIITLDGGSNNVLRISPLQALDPKSRYLVVVTNDVVDANNQPLTGSPSYTNLADPDAPLGSSSLAPLKVAVAGWERLAAGWFNNVMGATFDKVNTALGAEVLTPPSADDIVLSQTFTTTSGTDVLNYIGAPETFFERNLRIGYRQDAIKKIVGGLYNLDGDNASISDPVDQAVNSTINFLLTNTGSPLYNPDIAAAIGAGATSFAAFSGNASAQYLIELASAEAAIQVANGDGTTILAEAETQAAQPVSASATFRDLFVPANRLNAFYSTGNSIPADINPALPPSLYSQGEIDLPYFLPLYDATAGDEPTKVQAGGWVANTALGAPSENVTYRYPFPTQTGTQTAPVLVTYPDESVIAAVGASKPAGGWPVIIFQHGITTDRSATLPFASAMAFACVDTNGSELPADWAPSGAQCFATVAIDQPLHGVSAEGSTVPGLSSVGAPGFDPVAAGASATLGERHFNLYGQTTADGIVATAMDYANNTGDSGSLFINLSDFVNGRDNLRQGAVDLMNLNASLGTMDFDGAAGADLDTSKVYFIGHSLGGVNGIPFVAVNNQIANDPSLTTNLNPIKAAAFLNTGGMSAKLLENSPDENFGAATILAGLNRASDGVLVQGSSALETYLKVFQAHLDQVDPVTSAAAITEGGNTGVLLTEIVGDGTVANPSDQTIPNAADEAFWTSKGLDEGDLAALSGSFSVNGVGVLVDSLPVPLAGTEPVVAEFGAEKTATASGTPRIAVTRFTEGSHGTPVSASNTEADPLTSGAVFVEMVTQAATLFSTDGASIGVTNTTVVED